MIQMLLSDARWNLEEIWAWKRFVNRIPKSSPSSHVAPSAHSHLRLPATCYARPPFVAVGEVIIGRVSAAVRDSVSRRTSLQVKCEFRRSHRLFIIFRSL
ncbi:unnamed protein product [Citrullus colocynthis]|uniref:Uncharacterized protein n=1 Tax=Citrullus colocynthis TaxID=252529 RepID=A0ABP0XTD2_9ROSI